MARARELATQTGRTKWFVSIIVFSATVRAFVMTTAAAAAAAAAAVTQSRCPIIGSPPRKVYPRQRQFIGKNPPRPAAARVGRIFTRKLSAGGDFSGRWSYNRGTFYGAGDILIRGRHINSVIISLRADFLWEDILMWHRLCTDDERVRSCALPCLAAGDQATSFQRVRSLQVGKLATPPAKTC